MSLRKLLLPCVLGALLDLFGNTVQIDGSVLKLSVDGRKYQTMADCSPWESPGFLVPHTLVGMETAIQKQQNRSHLPAPADVTKCKSREL